MSYIKYEVEVHSNGSKFWYLNGEYHRLDGPACEYSDGTKVWYMNGKLHREDGPAMEKADGSKYWCKHDQLHNDLGPAVEFADGTKKWYINDEELTESEFNNRTKIKELTISDLQSLLGYKIKIIE